MKENKKKFTVAAIQMSCVVGDREKNQKKAQKFIKEAAARGAKLICLPEIFDFGYDLEYLKENVPIGPSSTIPFLVDMARETSSYLIAGIAERNDNKLYNTAVIAPPDGSHPIQYQKIHLFSTSPIFENHIFTAGQDRVLFDTPFIRCGVMICYDIRFPEFARSLCLDNAQIIFMPSAFPFPRREAWRTLNIARALENQLFFVSANQVGKTDKSEFLGTSMIISPEGTILAEGNTTDECVLTATVEMNILYQHRELIPTLKHRIKNAYRL